MNRGAFFVIDGIDGCGKSTQAERLRENLCRSGHDAVLLRDPGSTQAGERIREMLLEEESAPISSVAELFLFLAARAQMVAETLEPLMNQGKTVISERYNMSTVAYQGSLKRFSAEKISRIIQLTEYYPEPDYIFILDISPEDAAERRGTQSDRIESRSLKYQSRVRDIFLAQARQVDNADILDALEDPEEIAEKIFYRVKHVLEQN